MAPKKHSLAQFFLRRRFWASGVGLVLIVWLGVSLALRPVRDADGSYSTYPYGLLTAAENEALDLLFQLREAVRSDSRGRGLKEPLTIIAIDDRAVEASRVRPQKWRRDWYASLIDRANEGGASVIGLDIFLGDEGGDSELDRERDRVLAESIGKAQKVFLIQTLEVGGHKEQRPLPLFTEAAIGVGFVEVSTDTDGSVRGMTPFLALPGGRTEFSLSTQLAQGYLQAQDGQEHYLTADASGGQAAAEDSVFLDGREVALRRDLNLQLDFRGRAPAFRTVSAADLLSNPQARLPEDLFRDRIVLIGEAYLGSQDTYSTPFSEPSLLARLLDRSLPDEPSRTFGVELHATAIATLLWGRQLKRPAYAWQIMMLLPPLSLAALAVLRLRALWGLLSVALLAAIALVVCSWAFNSYGAILPLAGVWLGMALLTPTGLALRYGHERLVREETEAERAQIMDILSRCVAPEVAEEMRRRGDQIMLINERRTVTVVFTDIRNFTSLSENSAPDQVVAWLNEYFRRMNEVVLAHGGFINKFIGDGLLLVFGAPARVDEGLQARRAVDCGLAMLDEVARLRREWEGTVRPQLQIGIGIHTGEAFCGTVGAEKRLEYTVIGDVVNLASRLEAKTKEVGVPLLLSQATARLLKDEYETVPVGELEVRGKLAATMVFTIKKGPRAGEAKAPDPAGRESNGVDSSEAAARDR
ncbi:MAG TPA: adenylate/guanylate cyclase domain-containing protein [Pyrinomonadaceae bacterium]|nr:adenylate/guanylate cyclase domain-containing protein [Pyrinomonadaceae bacterium]